LSDSLLRRGAALVALAGIAVAGYLTWAHFSDSSPFCVTGGGCETVQASSYSELAGVPVALLGLLSYAAILGLVLSTAPLARLAAATLAVIGLLFSGFLLAVQLFVIDALCTWCVLNDVVIAPTLAALTILSLRTS
jgi:uncharacterized membrane protein